jgi:hypothetical protein
MVNLRTKSISFKHKKRIVVPENERVLVENTHEAIVDTDVFNLCQKKLEMNRSRITKENEVTLFSGFLRCSGCNSHLSATSETQRRGRTYRYYFCNRYRVHGKTACTSHRINLINLTDIVLRDIKLNAHLAKNDEKLLFQNISKANNIKTKDKLSDYEKELSHLDKRKEEVESLIQKLFEEKYLSGISETVFKNLMKKYELESEELGPKIKNLENLVLKLKDDEKQISLFR